MKFHFNKKNIIPAIILMWGLILGAELFTPLLGGANLMVSLIGGVLIGYKFPLVEYK